MLYIINQLPTERLHNGGNVHIKSNSIQQTCSNSRISTLGKYAPQICCKKTF